MSNEFDNEYYVMDVDGDNNHPMLGWGATYYDPIIFPKPVEDGALELPMKIKFCKPYPKNPEIADILFLDGDLAVSGKVKSVFENMNIYGVQFFPAQIITNKEKVIEGHYIFHPWNRIAVVDKNNYEGDPVDEKGRIDSLHKFSLDEKALSAIPLEKRMCFHLAESKTERLIHQSVYEALVKESVTGFSFFKVSEWDENVMFR
jgi:hypothetical protein